MILLPRVDPGVFEWQDLITLPKSLSLDRTRLNNYSLNTDQVTMTNLRLLPLLLTTAK